MAFTDQCQLCQNADEKLRQIAGQLAADGADKQPILLTHFPLFRTSQEHCEEIDVTPELVASTLRFTSWSRCSQG